MQQIEKGLQLTRSLFVTSLLIGEPYTGKRTLVRTIFPATPIVDGADTRQLRQMLKTENELVIDRFDKVENPEELDFNGKRIVAIADITRTDATLDRLFAFIYRMPPLRERPEDVDALVEALTRRAREDLGIEEARIPERSRIDIRQNIRSLRASVYRSVLLDAMERDDLEEALEHYFERTLEGNNAYRENLGILERPLLRAGLKRYKSQLRLSDVLGINRNTLRKKLHEHCID
ncbi:helix-turn-helix domain-containing protein [Nitratifractor sp.]